MIVSQYYEIQLIKVFWYETCSEYYESVLMGDPNVVRLEMRNLEIICNILFILYLLGAAAPNCSTTQSATFSG